MPCTKTPTVFFAAEWYDVRLVVALVKQGSALLARGWVHTSPNGDSPEWNSHIGYSPNRRGAYFFGPKVFGKGYE